MPDQTRRVLWVSIFSAAFGMVEAIVVVYLRSLYYPEGFVLPLKPIGQSHLIAELFREFSTILMLVAVGALAGRSRWQKFAFFIIAFGIWDIFYYVWLKVFLDWPASLLDWDILFLLPVPWIGPVLAPVLISLLMIAAGVLILRREQKEPFSPAAAWVVLSSAGVAVILFTFMSDLDATIRSSLPKPYSYLLFSAGFFMMVGAVAGMFASRKGR